jgi:hypothetical protein
MDVGRMPPNCASVFHNAVSNWHRKWEFVNYMDGRAFLEIMLVAFGVDNYR